MIFELTHSYYTQSGFYVAENRYRELKTFNTQSHVYASYYTRLLVLIRLSTPQPLRRLHLPKSTNEIFIELAPYLN